MYYYERSLTATVDNIEHIESTSLYGRGIVKIFFQPGTDVATAQAQITAASQTVLKQMPAGVTPAAGSGLQRVLGAGAVAADRGRGNDRLAAVRHRDQPDPPRPGLGEGARRSRSRTAATPPMSRSTSTSRRCSPTTCPSADVARALGNQNIVLPAGDQKIGALDYLVETNASPLQLESFNALPIKQVGGATVTLGQVAHVYLGTQPLTNIVLVKRAAVGAAAGHQDRQRLHAGRRRGHQGQDPRRREDAARRA